MKSLVYSGVGWLVLIGPAFSTGITFAEHIAPVVFQNCTTCHRPGEAGPFPLTTYEEVRKRARLMAEVTADHTMPPWHADEGVAKFVGERRLTAEQIAWFTTWAESGAPEGDRSKTPPLPQFPQGWRHGTPDLVLTMDEAFTVPADGPDIYRQFVVPLALEEDRWVQAVEVRPGSRGALHHVLLWLDATGAARELDEKDAGPGFAKMGFRRTGSLGGWAVGGGPRVLPEGFAMELKKGSDLVLSSHFHPTGKEEREKTTIGLYFAKAAPQKRLVMLQLPPAFGHGAGIDIPPGKADFTVKDSVVLPVDTELVMAGAHAHYLGKSMEAMAHLPDGTSKPVFRISRWDFNWQDQYTYQERVFLPAGTRLEGTVVWDNSAENPNNPANPPVRVRWGEESTDEMGSVWFAAVASDPAQSRVLEGLGRRRVVGAVLAGAGGGNDGRGRELLKRAAALDANKDGRLSAEEIPERLRKSGLMELMDANQDGALDLQEFMQARDKWRELAKQAQIGQP